MHLLSDIGPCLRPEILRAGCGYASRHQHLHDTPKPI